MRRGRRRRWRGRGCRPTTRSAPDVVAKPISEDSVTLAETGKTPAARRQSAESASGQPAAWPSPSVSTTARATRAHASARMPCPDASSRNASATCAISATISGFEAAAVRSRRSSMPSQITESASGGRVAARRAIERGTTGSSAVQRWRAPAATSAAAMVTTPPSRDSVVTTGVAVPSASIRTASRHPARTSLRSSSTPANTSTKLPRAAGSRKRPPSTSSSTPLICGTIREATTHELSPREVPCRRPASAWPRATGGASRRPGDTAGPLTAAGRVRGEACPRRHDAAPASCRELDRAGRSRAPGRATAGG